MLLRSFSIAASILLLEATGFASLSLTPTRVDLNSSKKTQSVLLMNDTNETVTYRLGFAYRTMKASGETDTATPEEEKLMKPIEQMVLFSPKQVTLQPKQLQTVKFTYRNVPTATLDEYAAYVTFQEQDNSPKIPQLSDQPEDGGVAIKVKALFKISIPIFVSTATASTQHTTDIANLKIGRIRKQFWKGIIIQIFTHILTIISFVRIVAIKIGFIYFKVNNVVLLHICL